MALRTLASGPGYQVDVVYDDVAKTASAIQCINNSGKSVTIWKIVGGQQIDLVVEDGTRGTLDFLVPLLFIEPIRDGRVGFRVTGADAYGVSA